MYKTHFWLIRHGETEWNALRRLQGWLDIPLSETGRQQARQLGSFLQSSSFDHTIHAVVSSDLSRASETARLAIGHRYGGVYERAELRERCYGIYEGRDWSLLNGTDPERPHVNFRQLNQPVEGGESLAQFAARIRKALESLARDYAGQNVMVFAHGGVIDIAWRLSGNVALDAPRPSPIVNTSINQFSIDGQNTWEQIAWAQVPHLDDALDDVL
jgi:probable phosphoglycerate mutase